VASVDITLRMDAIVADADQDSTSHPGERV
jgi:hypothetical protein